MRETIKKLVDQSLIIEGVFSGIYGNWILEIIKYFKTTVSFTLFVISMLFLLAFYLWVVEKPYSRKQDTMP